MTETNKKFIANAFSLQMLKNSSCSLSITEISEQEFDKIKTTAISVVGHPDTARVLGVLFNRVSVQIGEGDTLYVAQLSGGRLPEGATELPEGCVFKYYKISVKDE